MANFVGLVASRKLSTALISVGDDDEVYRVSEKKQTPPSLVGWLTLKISTGFIETLLLTVVSHCIASIGIHLYGSRHEISVPQCRRKSNADL